MIINHSTLEYHVTLGGSYGQFKTLTLYSDPKPNPNRNQNPNPNPNPNEKFDLLPYIAMSRDVT